MDVDMTTEVFETPDPEVTIQPYAAVSRAHRAGAAPEDAHFYDKVSVLASAKIDVRLVHSRDVCVSVTRY